MGDLLAAHAVSATATAAADAANATAITAPASTAAAPAAGDASRHPSDNAARYPSADASGHPSDDASGHPSFDASRYSAGNASRYPSDNAARLSYPSDNAARLSYPSDNASYHPSPPPPTWAVAKQDPHLTLTHEVAPIRGCYGCLFNFLSARDLSVDIKIEAATSTVAGSLVPGTFLTEVQVASFDRLKNVWLIASYWASRLARGARSTALVEVLLSRWGQCSARLRWHMLPLSWSSPRGNQA
jgi:hypothetical protein